MRRVFLTLLGAIVLLDAVAWVAAVAPRPPIIGAPIRPAFGASAMIEFDYCPAEEAIFAPVCDPVTYCEFDNYTCQLSPRTGWYIWRHVGLCGECGPLGGRLRDGAATPASMRTSSLQSSEPSSLVPSAQTLDLASVSPAGAPASGGSSLAPVLSGDGRFVAFDSAAANLVAGDTNGKRDVFVRDRLLALTTRVSVSSGAAEGTGHSIAPVITPDGRYVAFLSQAPNLVANDTNGLGDVFVHDRLTAQTERVNLQPGGLQAAQASWPDEDGGLDTYEGFMARSEELAISDDGRFVTFVTETAAGRFAISLRDRLAATTTIITPQQPLSSTIVSSSVGNPTVITTAGPHGLASGDAVEITGHSAVRPCDNPGGCSINTVPNHNCGFFIGDILLTPQSVTVLSATTFSVALNVTQAGTGGSITRVQDVRVTARPRVSMSSTGGLVAFDWLYQIAVADTFRGGSGGGGRCFATPDQRDVYLYERQTGTTTLVSVDAAGQSANGYSGWPSISGDGRYIAFASEASNLVPGDTDGARNIFVRDRQAGTMTRVGSQGHAITPSISKDGRKVVFAGLARVGPARAFVYLYDLASNQTEFVNRSGEAFGLDGPSIGPSLSGDGSTIAFASAASNIATGDTNGLDDVFVGTFVAPAITTQPVNVGSVVVGGSAARFTVAATGFPAPRYRWQVSTDSGASWSDAAATIPSRIPGGATNPDLYVFATAVMNGYRFRAIVSSSAGSATSNSAALSLCQYALSPSGAAIAAGGGSGTFTVTTEPGCTWTPVSQDAFITLTSTFTRVGTWPISYTVAPYSGVPRTGRVVVADQTFTITQAGADPTMTLDRTALNFAGSDGSPTQYKTPTQFVRLLQNGPGTVSWKAQSSAPWLVVSPGAGTGSAALAISTFFGGGLPASGLANATITLTLTGAGNAVGPINVTFNRLVHGTGTPPTGQFDTPLNGTTGVTGSIAVTGWAVDDVEVRRVRILRNPVQGEGSNPVFLGNAVFVDGARPDVQAQFPAMPLNSQAGWGYLLLTNFLPNLGNGTFTLYAIADDADGHSTLLGSRTITCTNASATTPFGAIDTPAQGETVSGSVNNFGWVLAPGTRRADPPGGGTVLVLIDGAFLSQVPAGWTSRSDLSGLFPIAQFSGIETALGVASFDTTTLANGVHTLAWLVTDNSNPPEAAGIGSRYFTVANGAASVTASTHLSDAALGPPAAADIDRLPPSRAGRVGRRGFDSETAYRAYPADRDGRIVMRSEELDRLELGAVESGERDATFTGYLRVAGGLAPIPIGSSLNRSTGAFTWNPGVGFVGTYDLVFVAWRNHLPVSRQEVRIVLHPQGTAPAGAQVAIDAPQATTTFAAGERIIVAGWAADLDSTTDRGVDTVHVWAYPARSAPASAGEQTEPVFLGAASYGGARPDVASTYGDRFKDTGYGITIDSLPPGTYDVAVFAYSTVRNAFAPAKTVRVTIR